MLKFKLGCYSVGRNRATVECPQKNKRKKCRGGKGDTQLVLNKYDTNYEALRLADLTALAFNLGKILLKLFTTS